MGSTPTNREVESSLIATLSNIYLGHFRLAAVRLNNVPEAFRILESARGRSIADQLRSGTEPRAPNDEVTQGATKELQRVQIQLLHASVPASRSALLDRLFETEQLVAPTNEAQTTFQKAALRNTPVSLSAIQGLLNPNETILEYVLDDPQSFCLYVTHDRAGLSPLPANRADVETLVATYRAEILNRSLAPPSASKLYDVLLKPLPVSILKPNLVIVPDGKLNLVPFDALMDGTGDYLLRSHVVSYAPSATVLTLVGHRRKASPPPIAFLGVGGVRYQGPSTAQRNLGERESVGSVRDPFDPNGGPLPDIPESADEVTSAGTIFGKSSVLLLGPDATEAAFKAEPLDQFRIIHIAAHGIASSKFPDRAALVLGEDPEHKDDGLLQAREIRQLRLHAELVTLSACDTGAGRLEGEEGIESLERVFLFAGAQSVLASLWETSDIYTQSLMDHFYRRLVESRQPAQALRQAKLDLIQEFGDQAVPRLWSGFVIVGDVTQ
jgi:CHAT domain-containing protein